ncbi:hypothetical protein AAFF_G00147820 [Aldrovandia affinis]|uniref:THAP-type domain-containing protein n=1 Tax=Aldrovandia affinis TaxID=143900 RepID=A0AAD7RPF2_9TELE|nr:hypothetical protein AAFF_G00147820 [Aldrovandia affinis]
MVKCCAWGKCNSDTRYPDRFEGDIRFFPFIKPKSNPEKCRLWIKLCGRPHTQLNTSKINRHSFVCSKHFVNGKPSPEYPNPASAVPDGRGNAVRCRPPPTKRVRCALQGVLTDITGEMATESLVEDTTTKESTTVTEMAARSLLSWSILS